MGKPLRTLCASLFVVLLLFIFAVGGWQAALERYAGGWSHAPEDAPWLLSPRALALIDESFADLNGPVVDHRVQLLAFGERHAVAAANSTQPVARPAPSWDPRAWAAQRMRRHAAGVHGADDDADAEYVSRLLRQMQSMPDDYRALVFARDGVYDERGELVQDASRDFVSNVYAVGLGQRADWLTPVISVHPARADALAALESWAVEGVCHVGWLPAAQRIDLDSARATRAYRLMSDYGMTLHTRVGGWPAPDGALRTIEPRALRAAMEAGVDVVVTIGKVDAREVDVMEQLFDLLREPAYRERLHIALAGVLAAGQLESVLVPLLQHPQFFDRLVYASDYPTTARATAIRAQRLADQDFIDPALVTPLRAIYDVNPLLYTLVTLRNVRLPTTGLRLPPEVFTGHGC